PLLSASGDTPVEPARQRDVLCEIRDLAFGYARHGPQVFDNLSLTLHRGDRIALLGSNGSGKSTLLNLLAGLLKPRAGQIAWSGDRRPSVGLVMQVPDLMLFSESVRQEVAFAPIHARMPRHEREAVVDAVLERMGLRDLADQAPFALSRGERLRTAVGSILSKQPSVLLLDEPTTGQDREQIERMMTGLEDDFELVVFCTHDVQTAARHANRIVLLDAGRVVADGEPVDVLFDRKTVESASIRQTSLQTYAMRHGVRAFDVDSLLRILS
ncbi:MAG: ABC transporter ATP-binding protein, partial [Planctomycetes bacterium]|nr:ABC transporter ATP-binding protein [Planctomycetota bacterium]